MVRFTATASPNRSFVKDVGDQGDEEQKDGGEVGGQQLHRNLPVRLQGIVNCTLYMALKRKRKVHHVGIPLICHRQCQVCNQVRSKSSDLSCSKLFQLFS